MKFVELFKMEVSMDKVSNHLANINTSNWSLRKNKFDSNLVYCTCMNVTLAQVEKRFSEIRFLIPGRCYSVQLFFKGPLPAEITNEQRFRRVPNENSTAQTILDTLSLRYQLNRRDFGSCH